MQRRRCSLSCESKNLVRPAHDLPLPDRAASVLIEFCKSHGAQPINARDCGNVLLQRAAGVLALADASRKIW